MSEEKEFCIDCQKMVELDVYNGDVEPPVVMCKICGQFCYKEDRPVKTEEGAPTRYTKHEGDF